jgi:cytochrome c
MEAPLRFYTRFLALFVVILLMVGFHFMTWGLHRTSRPLVWYLPDAHPERGPSHIRKYGCSACHTLPGNSNAKRLVGPSLESMKDRMYIAGKLPNTPRNLMLWIQDPQQIRPHTAMPDLNVGSNEARDITAFLFDQQITSPLQ